MEVLVIILLLFLPWAIALMRGNNNVVAVFLINLFLGWTIIGWFVALMMAVSGEKKTQTVYVINQPTVPVAATPAPEPTYSSATKADFGGARTLIPSPSRQTSALPADRCCTIKQNAVSQWYIESAFNPGYAWGESRWVEHTNGIGASTFVWREGAEGEAQLRGFQVIC